jgi:hypothetical protein
MYCNIPKEKNFDYKFKVKFNALIFLLYRKGLGFSVSSKNWSNFSKRIFGPLGISLAFFKSKWTKSFPSILSHFFGPKNLWLRRKRQHDKCIENRNPQMKVAFWLDPKWPILAMAFFQIYFGWMEINKIKKGHLGFPFLFWRWFWFEMTMTPNFLSGFILFLSRGLSATIQAANNKFLPSYRQQPTILGNFWGGGIAADHSRPFLKFGWSRDDVERKCGGLEELIGPFSPQNGQIIYLYLWWLLVAWSTNGNWVLIRREWLSLGKKL